MALAVSNNPVPGIYKYSFTLVEKVGNYRQEIPVQVRASHREQAEITALFVAGLENADYDVMLRLKEITQL